MNGGDNELWKYFVFPIIAAFGAVTNYAKRAVKMREFALVEFCAEGASAAFIGVMVTMGGTALQLDPLWLGVGAGMSGWMGSDFVRALFTTFIHNKLGQSNDTDN